MIRSSSVAKAIGVSLLVLGSFACGDKPPANVPESTPASAMDGGDAPATATESHADAGATTAAEPPAPAPAPAALALPSAAAKLKFKSTKAFDGPHHRKQHGFDVDVPA